jgi:hypothetical protein
MASPTWLLPGRVTSPQDLASAFRDNLAPSQRRPPRHRSHGMDYWAVGRSRLARLLPSAPS